MCISVFLALRPYQGQGQIDPRGKGLRRILSYLVLRGSVTAVIMVMLDSRTATAMISGNTTSTTAITTAAPIFQFSPSDKYP